MAAFNAPASTVLLYEDSNDVVNVTAPQEGCTAPCGPGLGGSVNVTMSGIGNGDEELNSASFQGNNYYATGYLGGDTAHLGSGSGGGTGYYTTSPGSGATGRHTDGSNYLFTDGHAKWLRGTAVSPGITATAPTNGQVSGNENAAGTGNLTGDKGQTFAATFSPT